ncbi:MAG: BMP family lipoprotein, partial [Desulfosoma sp.]
MGKRVRLVTWSIMLLAAVLLRPATPTWAEEKPFVFGLLLVGPYNDKGWSQAHYDAGLYVERKIPGAKMLYIDKVNP